MSRTYNYKVTVVGDGAVGKTTLVLKYTEKRFRESYIPTIGCQWTLKEIEYQGNHIVLTLWDIAGQDIFKTMRGNFYDGSNATIIVFDVTSLISFDHVENWYREVRQFCGNIPYILLGNKIDLVEERKVTREIAESFAYKYGLPYFETSAKTGENVIDIFSEVIEKVRKFEPLEADIIMEPLETVADVAINLSEEIEILIDLIKNDEKLFVINKEFRAITNEIFKQNPYHEKLEEMTKWRLEKLMPYRDDENLNPSDKEDFLNKIQEWKSVLVS